MSSLLEIRENIRNFYSRNEVYLQPLFKFLLALVALLMINGNLGFMSKIDNIFIVLVLALMCSFLPINLISAVFVILHFYAVSMECAVVGGVVFLLMLLLYYRFAPKDALIVLLLPLCFVLKIPYAIPIIVGLLCTPASVVSVACGVIVYYMMDYVKLNATVISSLDADNAVSKFRYVMDGLMNNKAMLIVLISFCITTIIVYVIRRLSVDHAWTIAMFAGAVVSVVMLLLGDLTFDTNISVVATILGTVVSLLLAKLVEFFAFNVDYTRTEYVQFEDDEYYYYVKAVPKIKVTQKDRNVTDIKSGENEDDILFDDITEETDLFDGNREEAEKE